MKKYLLFTIILVATTLLIFSCGESKKDIPEEGTDTQEQMTEEEAATEAEAATTEETKAEEKEETTLGEAPEAEAPKKIDYSKTPLKCSIVVLDDVATGNYRKLTKPAAQDLVAKGKILIVKAENGDLYFVYNQDGSFASKTLAKYAANEYIGIIGKVKKQYGLNIIIAEIIESLD
jgi:hypothetical protein